MEDQPDRPHLAITKRILIAYDPNFINRGEALKFTALGSRMGIEFIVVQSRFTDGPPLLLFDLDNLPAPEPGVYQAANLVTVSEDCLNGIAETNFRRATDQERERCARIVEGILRHYDGDGLFRLTMRIAIEAIAARIRSGE